MQRKAYKKESSFFHFIVRRYCQECTISHDLIIECKRGAVRCKKEKKRKNCTMAILEQGRVVATLNNNNKTF